MSRIAILVFARMDSMRLPGKVLADLAGRPMLGRVLDRLRRAGLVQRLIVATSGRGVDDEIEAYARQENVECFRGAGEDVAGRALACCEDAGLDRFVRISGDSPFIPFELIDHAIETSAGGDFDVVTNVAPRTFPPGASVEVIRTEALRRCHSEMTAEQREHVTAGFYAAPDKWKLENFSAPDDRYKGICLTVDTAAELERARAIIQRLRPNPESATLDSVVACANSLQLEGLH